MLTKPEGFFDTNLFSKEIWRAYLIGVAEKRTLSLSYFKDFRPRSTYTDNMKKQFLENVSKTTSLHAIPKSTGQEPPTTTHVYRTAKSRGISKDDKSPIEEQVAKTDLDKDLPPPSTVGAREDDDKANGSIYNDHGSLSLPSLVQQKRIYESSSDDGSDSDDSRGETEHKKKQRQQKQKERKARNQKLKLKKKKQKEKDKKKKEKKKNEEKKKAKLHGCESESEN